MSRTRKKIDIENDPEHIMEAELLNRVILAKCVMAVTENQPVTLRTRDQEEYTITPKIARGLMRLAKTKSHSEKSSS